MWRASIRRQFRAADGVAACVQQLSGPVAVRHRPVLPAAPIEQGLPLLLKQGHEIFRHHRCRQPQPVPWPGRIDLAPGSWPVRSTRSARTTTRSLSPSAVAMAATAAVLRPTESTRVRWHPAAQRHSQPWKSSTCAHINAATWGLRFPAPAAGARGYPALVRSRNPRLAPDG